MTAGAKRVEFRIPISPTPGFFAQVRFFNFALRRLGPAYANARLVVVVGDKCDIDAVRRENAWSEDFNIVWKRVPDAIFDEFGMWGTADWRMSLPAEEADVVVLSDADTVLLRDIDPLIEAFPTSTPAVRGHMAHLPPPVTVENVPPGASPAFWPWLFQKFDIALTNHTYRYSMDTKRELPLGPAYFNLGFVAMNGTALSIIDAAMADVERRVKALTESHMRCQISMTVVAYQTGLDINVLPAEYNAANDLRHLEANGLAVEDIRVLHYLRRNEIERSSIFTREHIDSFLGKRLNNPANRSLQALAGLYRETLH